MAPCRHCTFNYPSPTPYRQASSKSDDMGSWLTATVGRTTVSLSFLELGLINLITISIFIYQDQIRCLQQRKLLTLPNSRDSKVIRKILKRTIVVLTDKFKQRDRTNRFLHWFSHKLSTLLSWFLNTLLFSLSMNLSCSHFSGAMELFDVLIVMRTLPPYSEPHILDGF